MTTYLLKLPNQDWTPCGEETALGVLLLMDRHGTGDGSNVADGIGIAEVGDADRSPGGAADELPDGAPPFHPNCSDRRAGL